MQNITRLLNTIILALSVIFMSTVALAANPEVDVIIVGAGMAGLSAARYLTDHGKKVIVLEARDRIGGRIWSYEDKEGHVDLGASWIHGTKGNPLTALAKEFHIPTVRTNYDNIVVYNAEGVKLGDDAHRKIEKLEEDFFQTVDEEEEYQELSMYHAFRRYAREKHLSTHDARLLHYGLILDIQHEDAADLKKLPAYDDSDDEELGVNEGFSGHDVIFPNGYAELLKPLLPGLDIKLNHIVTVIDYHSTPVRVTTNQETFLAKAVISTLPLGVLKKKVVHFIPDLPERKRHAIERLNMGVLDKVYLRFDNVFWDKNAEVMLYLPEKGFRWIDFLNLHHYTQKPALIAFSGGDRARAIEQLSDDEIIKSIMAVLNKINPETPRQLLSYKITRWANDPYAYGSYSYSPMEAKGTEYEILGESVQGTLFFAGEATSPEYSATVHGAYLSGIRAAKEVIRQLS